MTAKSHTGPLSFFGNVGKPVLDITRQLIELFELFGLTLLYCFRGHREPQAIAKQFFYIGNRSMVFVTVTLTFLGMITVFQVTNQVQQVLPELSLIGPAFIQLLIREFGPTICGLMVATRVGSGIAAEIGSMVVTEQIDALKMSNADPVHYLIAPRFIACSVMMVVLSIYAVLVAMTSGLLMAMAGFGIHPMTFLNLGLVRWADVIIGLSKAAAYGMAIPVIAAQSGLNTTGGSEGVGWATTMAVVNSSFAVIVLDLVISVGGYLVLY